MKLNFGMLFCPMLETLIFLNPYSQGECAKAPSRCTWRLGRQVRVRKRKDEVHEMNGHKFVQKQFYQLLLCAFCNEFLLNAAGYQCEDCRYTCHKKCFEKVVTKCISKSTTGVSILVLLLRA